MCVRQVIQRDREGCHEHSCPLVARINLSQPSRKPWRVLHVDSMDRVHKQSLVAISRLIPGQSSAGNENIIASRQNKTNRRQLQNRVNQRAFRQRQRTSDAERALEWPANTVADEEAEVANDVDDANSVSSVSGVDRPPFLVSRTQSAPAATTLGSKNAASGTTAAGSRNEEQPRFLSRRTKSATATAPASASGEAGHDYFSHAGETSTLLQREPPSGPPVFERDELSLLIQRNVMDGASANAQHLGINPNNLLEGVRGNTLSREELISSDSLKPGKLQGEVQHHAIIDILPCPQLRHQLLQALAAGTLDEERFCEEVRESGALNVEGCRCGLLCWGAPDDLADWEMSEPFVRRWSFVLSGCERLFESTNLWRSRRSEKAIGVSP